MENIYSKKIRRIDSEGELPKIEFESSKRDLFVPDPHLKKAWTGAFGKLSEISEEQTLI